MRYPLYIFFILVIFCSCVQQKEIVDNNSFTYFTRQSKLGFEWWDKNRDIWRETENDTVILTKYIRGSGCDLPVPEKMSVEMVNDTLIFDFGRVYDPDCERTIGVAGIYIDFLVNKRKYPNYRKLILKYKYDNPKG